MNSIIFKKYLLRLKKKMRVYLKNNNIFSCYVKQRDLIVCRPAFIKERK